MCAGMCTGGSRTRQWHFPPTDRMRRKAEVHTDRRQQPQLLVSELASYILCCCVAVGCCTGQTTTTQRRSSATSMHCGWTRTMRRFCGIWPCFRCLGSYSGHCHSMYSLGGAAADSAAAALTVGPYQHESVEQQHTSQPPAAQNTPAAAHCDCGYTSTSRSDPPLPTAVVSCCVLPLMPTDPDA